MADGYLPIRDLRYNFKPRLAWKLRVTPKRVLGAFGQFDENRPTILLNYQPASPGETVYGGIDGNIMRIDFASGKCTFRPDAGTHTVTLNLNGQIWKRTYELIPGQTVEDQVIFSGGVTEKWDIREPGGLYILSEPPGATVYMNQVESGVTPLTIEDLQPGIYEINVVKDLYLADSRAVEVNSLDYTDISFELTPNFGRLKIESDPPEAMIWINEQQRGTTPYDVPRFNAGRYSLRLAHNLYYEKTDTFEIEPGGSFMHKYDLKPRFGKVSITSEPSGASVTVDGAV